MQSDPRGLRHVQTCGGDVGALIARPIVRTRDAWLDARRAHNSCG
jgi:hypothetical protein